MFTLELDAPAAGAARLRLSGHLDDEAARDVLHAAADAVRCGCARLVVDLEGLTGYDEAATYALTGCARLGRFLAEGVGVVAGGPAGHELAEQAGVQDDLVARRTGAHAEGPPVAARRTSGPDTLDSCRAC